MNDLIEVQKKLLPDLLEVMTKRYSILKIVRFHEPIGRRNLAVNLNMTERVLRSEVNFLKDQGLLSILPGGMSLTQEGLSVLERLEVLINELSGLRVLEMRLRENLSLSEVIIVPGDSDKEPWIKNEMGKAAAMRLKLELTGHHVIAVTGGTTTASVAEMMTPGTKDQDLLFVPARGGLGEKVENQANTICSTMAAKARGKYRLLHLPDQLSKETYLSLMEEPGVKEVMELIHSASIVIHGIGDAKTMANRRNSSSAVLEKLEREKAVAEAFGYYFNQKGEVVHRVRTIGLQLNDLKHSDFIMAVAGGSSKAEAIAAFMKHGPKKVLVTDEGAANKLLSGT
ncbi:sugar-binding domain-containing protein [Fictibacillus enclensis]|uniref:sugar-binding transcriptional regulator n=1 Tax=Fictibacillus enclensis TaxID=1017270 RepID=UPI0024C0E314|nr:sugar-binding domain-containing protein [Fictibacillus enclensis]MDM5200602.1 sugar-binding domain-containing protein [Fictibacillus enclensis]MDM5339954.1 sugar-binding domain-containing protein [Fictibacillus enclensis]WHY71484.1 sugar-binding domain-containing protein [Fictibacillus enclensis]